VHALNAVTACSGAFELLIAPPCFSLLLGKFRELIKLKDIVTTRCPQNTFYRDPASLSF